MTTQGMKAPAVIQTPLREATSPQRMGPSGTIQEGGSVFFYQPFSTTDLLNWKHHIPPYSEKLQAMIDLLESIFQTHRPTGWTVSSFCLCSLTLKNAGKSSLRPENDSKLKHPMGNWMWKCGHKKPCLKKNKTGTPAQRWESQVGERPFHLHTKTESKG